MDLKNSKLAKALRLTLIGMIAVGVAKTVGLIKENN